MGCNANMHALRKRKYLTGIGLLLALAVGPGCSNTGGADPALTPVEVVDSGSHCATPPERAGAVILATDKADGFRVRLGMGQRSTGGYAVRIVDESPERTDDGIAIVRVDWRVPGAEDAVTQALTRPCVEIDVPAEYRGVRFIDADGVVRGEAVRADGGD